MTTRYTGDCCPACGSNELLPFAIIVGAAETYGYQCLSCSVTWPILQSGTLPDARALSKGCEGPSGMSSPALALVPVLPASTGTGATTGPAQPAGHRNHVVRETRMETRRAGNRGASQASRGLGAPLLPLFFHPASRPRPADSRP